MPNNEFSKKNYKSVVKQQGRVHLDPDGNEHVLLKGQVRDLIENVKPTLAVSKSIEDRRLIKGYRTIFCGPPNSGKASTAELVARELKKDLYKVDLAMVVSKYIGETEKNLELLFARAEDKGWILFFDEADALFGKRTGVRDAHDKYANQEVAYLLKKVEDYNGLVIVSLNSISSIDKPVTSHFHSIIKFPISTP